MAMTTQHDPSETHLRRNVRRVFGLAFVTMLTVQATGAALALRRRRAAIVTPDPASDEISLIGIFGPLHFTSTAQEFRGGSLACLFGGGTLDLRGATLAPDGATLRVQAFSGGAQILVPASWRIESKVIGLGGVGDGRPEIERPADAPVLRIEGWTMFGGFGVASEESGDRVDLASAPQPVVAI